MIFLLKISLIIILDFLMEFFANSNSCNFRPKTNLRFRAIFSRRKFCVFMQFLLEGNFAFSCNFYSKVILRIHAILLEGNFAYSCNFCTLAYSCNLFEDKFANSCEFCTLAYSHNLFEDNFANSTIIAAIIKYYTDN